MPSVGPGNDNITGERYTLDVGVSPDLGGLLQNLQVANDLLDAAEEKFRTIGDIVASGTQRMAQFTRQTQLASAESQRLATQWQMISASAGTLQGIGGMAAGPGFGPYMPGQMAFQGMTMPSMQPQQAQQVMYQPSPPGSQEDIANYGLPPAAPAPQMPNLRWVQLEQGKELLFGSQGGPGRPLGGIAGKFVRPGSAIDRAVSDFRTGYQSRLMQSSAASAAKSSQALLRASGMTSEGLSAASSIAQPLGAAGAAEAVPGLAAAEGAGMLGGIGAGAAALAGPAAIAFAGFQAAKKVYNVWAENTAAARRLSGITGNTGLVSGTGGGVLGLSARAKFGSFINPGVDYAGIQEQALGAGYIGQSYEQSRDYLFEASKRGLGDVIDQLDVYQEAVDKGGASVGQLTDAMDRMKFVAANTNASLTDMAKNYKANLEMNISLGMGGGAANASALTAATAYANAGGAFALSPVLRNLGGYDLNAPLTRSYIAQSIGTSYTGVEGSLYRNPEQGQMVQPAAEQNSKRMLASWGFRPGMSLDQISQMLDNHGGAQAIPALQSMGVLPPGIDDYASAVGFIQGNTNGEGPISQEMARTQAAETGTTDISGALRKHYTDVYGEEDASRLMANASTDRGTLINQYLEESNIAVGESGGFLGIGGHDNPIGSWYSDYLSDPNHSTIPVLEKMLTGNSAEDLARAYVQSEDGSAVKLVDWLNMHTADAATLLKGGKVKISFASEEAEQQIAAGGTGIGNVAVQDLWHKASTPDQIMTSAPPTDGSSGGESSATSTTALDDRTINTLADRIGESVAKNS